MNKQYLQFFKDLLDIALVQSHLKVILLKYRKWINKIEQYLLKDYKNNLFSDTTFFLKILFWSFKDF